MSGSDEARDGADDQSDGSGPSRARFRERRQAERTRRAGMRLVITGIVLIAVGGGFLLWRDPAPDPPAVGGTFIERTTTTAVDSSGVPVR